MSKHFTLDELCDSSYAARHQIPNRPNDAVRSNLLRLMDVLEAVRTVVGDRPVVVTSGYRSPAVNAGIGGSRTSAHMDGRAADIRVLGMTPTEAAKRIRDSDIEFDQLIFEGTWVHIGIAKSHATPRVEVLTALFTHGGVRYVKGIMS